MLESKCPVVSLCFFLSLANLPAFAQSGAKGGEWRTYGGDLGNTRYAPLDQITADNFSKLEVAWRFKTDNLGPRPETNLEATPLMVNGVLYSTAGDAAGSGGAGRGYRRTAVGARRKRRSARRCRPPTAFRPRTGILDRRPRRTHPICHARLSADRA